MRTSARAVPGEPEKPCLHGGALAKRRRGSFHDPEIWECLSCGAFRIDTGDISERLKRYVEELVDERRFVESQLYPPTDEERLVFRRSMENWYPQETPQEEALRDAVARARTKRPRYRLGPFRPEAGPPAGSQWPIFWGHVTAFAAGVLLALLFCYIQEL